MILKNVQCPNCEKILTPRIGEKKNAATFEDCLRQCSTCNIGFSNSKTRPTIIHRNHRNNVPVLLRDNIDLVLDNSINLRSRKTKKFRFGFSTSEDALTWSFFNYFVVKKKLPELLKVLEIESSDKDPEVYLWGVNITAPELATEFLKSLITQSDKFGEVSTQRTEPDVILKFNDKLVFIEVKYRSPNDFQTDKNKFNKYLIADVDINRIATNGCYELYRNWAFASQLSNGKKFEVINLGFQKHFANKKIAQLEEFAELTKAANGRFLLMSWENVLKKMTEDKYDDWFLKHIRLALNDSPTIGIEKPKKKLN